VLAVIAALAVYRQGLRGSWDLIRERLPLVAVGVFLVVGAIAAVRGLAGYGFDNLTEDIGLALYALLLPIAVLVVDTRERLWLMARMIVFAGVAAIALWTFAYLMAVLFDVRGIPFPRGGSAAGLYMSIPTLWVAARLAYGLPLHRLEIVAGIVGLIGVGLTDQRGNWLALAAGLAVLALLAPAGRRMRASAVTASAVIAMGAGTIGIESAVSAAGATPAHQATASSSESESGGGDRGSQATKELSDVTGGESAEGSNSAWRLSIWGYSLERMVDSPLGISLGRPLAYEWRGRRYDFRTGNPNDYLDVTGPHNSFLEVGARMGVAGLIALIAIVAYAGWRGFGVVRNRAVESDDRFLAAAMLAVVACGVVIASFNDALKGPYHGLFFWLPIGLLLIAPFVLRPKSPAS